MGRLPDEWIDQIKSDIPIQDLVEAAGIELKRQGGNWMGLCPFHDDREPSLVVTPAKNLWHCLGACQSGGSPIDWTMKSEGKSFREAVVTLKDRYLPHLKNQNDLLPINSDMDDQTLLRAVIGYYHQTLKEKSEAQDYLRFRGIDSKEAVDTFKLGFANRSLCFRLPERGIEEGDAMRERLCALSIYRKQTGHEHFNGALVFPVIDEEGKITEIYGRKIGRHLRKGTALHLYLDRAGVAARGLRQRGVWNISGLAELKAHSGELILCESLIDALTFWVNGFRNVTASYGTNGCTPDHLAAFKSHKIKRILLAYDADEAGDQAAMKLAEHLIAEGFTCYRVVFPAKHDANSFARSSRDPGSDLDRLIQGAVWLGPGPKPSLSQETFALHQKSTGTAAKREKQLKTKPNDDLRAPTTDNCQPPTGSAIPVEHRGPEILITLDDRTYRIRGLDKNHRYDQLKVNVMVRKAEAFHTDALELYSDYQRCRFVKRAAEVLGVPESRVQGDVSKLLLTLEEMQAERLQRVTDEGTADGGEEAVEMTDEDREKALALLRDPRLVDRILSDFEACGLVG